MSYGFGLIVGHGKTDMANKIVKWELKQLSRIGQWILKHLFQTIADIFAYLAKQCGGQKKKKTP
ncbi:MAG: hypothetical protein WCG02_00070 [Candidatus Taylorbacteria bacterium]